MWEFRLIDLFSYYSWHFIYIRLNSLDDRKYDCLKVFIKYIYVYLYGFRIGVGAPHL
jgi:hypothetical protein